MTGTFLAMSLAAVVAGTPELAPDVREFCAYTRAAANQEALRLMMPEAFASFGWLHQPIAVFGDVLGDRIRPRLLVGASYSLGGLYRGALTRDLAAAECARYATVSQLTELLQTDGRGLAWRAFRARLQVLENALPRADEMLADARGRQRDGATTTTDVAVLAIRVDGLRAFAEETRRDAEALAPPSGAMRPTRALLEEHDADERRAAAAAARLRSADAWDLELRGAYDQVYGVDERIPWFGLITLRVSFGWPWQIAEGERAVRAHRGWAAVQRDGTVARVEQVLRVLEATRRAERRRLAENTVLLADLEERLGKVSKAAPDRADRFLDVIWFEAVKAAAENAYLKTHLEDLDALLGPEGRTNRREGETR